MGEGLSIDHDFPGGNVVVERIEDDTVFLHQDLRDTEGDWFYWAFRVRGAAGSTLTFRFTGSKAIAARGPAVSVDGGESWSWLGAKSGDDASFTYDFGPDQDDVRFSFTIPYLEQHLNQFLQRNRDNPHLRVEELCTSEGGRKVELLRLAPVDVSPEIRMLFTARHHACEAMANYALEGLLQTVLDEADTGHGLLQRAEILVIPFVDKDGVERGDQGKNRKPHDHNRDYTSGESIYASVRAIRSLIPAWSDGRLRLALDFHCPARSGPAHEVVQFIETNIENGQRNWDEMQALSEILERHRQGPLPYSTHDNLALGQGWNTVSHVQNTFAGWVARLAGVQLSTSLELPYANASGQPVTPESAAALGRDLADTIQRYVAPIQ